MNKKGSRLVSDCPRTKSSAMRLREPNFIPETVISFFELFSNHAKLKHIIRNLITGKNLYKSSILLMKAISAEICKLERVFCIIQPIFLKICCQPY